MRYSRLKIKCSGELLEEIENYRTENVVVAAFLTSVKEGILERLSMNEGVSLAKEVRFTLPLDVYEAVQGENVEKFTEIGLLFEAIKGVRELSFGL